MVRMTQGLSCATEEKGRKPPYRREKCGTVGGRPSPQRGGDGAQGR